MMLQANAEQRLAAVDYLARRLAMNAEDIVANDRFDVFLACRGGNALGVVLYKNYSSGDIEMVCAGEPGWVTPSVVKFSLSYPFDALNCNRITCIAHRKNKAMRDYLVRMGFKLEGVKRRAIDGADTMIYGLLRREQRWA